MNAFDELIHTQNRRDLSELQIPVDYRNADGVWEFVKVGTHRYQRNEDSFVEIGSDFGTYGDSPQCMYLPESSTLRFALPFRIDYTLKKPADLESRLRDFFGESITVQGTVLYFDDGNRSLSINFSKQKVIATTSELIYSKERFIEYLELATNLHRALIQSYSEGNGQQTIRNTFTYGAPDNPVLKILRQYQYDRESTSAQKLLEPVTDTGVRFDMIVGQTAATSKARQLANMIQYMDVYSKYGAKLPKGILLFGPPGTGKTMIAKAIAQEADSTFVNLDVNLIIGQGLVGQAEHDTKRMFEEIRQLSTDKVVVVFIDEADKLLPSSSSGIQIHESTGNRISHFAQFMDGVVANPNVVFILSTNDPQDIDRRILSRMSDHIEMPLPDKSEINDLLVFFVTQQSERSALDLFSAELDIEILAEKCFEKRLSGRDIRDIMEMLVRNQGDKQLQLLQQALLNQHPQDDRPQKVIITEIFTDLITYKNDSRYAQYQVEKITTADILKIVETVKSGGKENVRYIGFS